MSEAAGPRQVRRGGSLGVREPVGGRVAVHHVDDPAVHQYRVGVGVEVEEGSQLLDAVAHVAHVKHPGVPSDEVGDQRLQLAEPQGERRSTDHRTHGHAAVPANVGVSDGSRLLVLVGVIHLVAAGPDHRISAEALTYVQLGPVQNHLHRRVDGHR